ncbi:MAG: TetR/AcrR family transcriptional regulator [Thermodesulfobacteriota bacterium]
MKINQSGPQQDILEAALRLFSSSGYFATSMQGIRKESGVSIGAIYHYFKNKEEIATALYDSLLEQMSERTSHYLITRGTFAAACQDLIKHFFSMAEEKPHALHFLLYARHREFLTSKKPICTAKPFELLIDAGRRAMDRGEVRQMDPVVLVTTIFGSPMRLMLLKVDGLLDAPLLDFFEEAWECIWRGVAAKA